MFRRSVLLLVLLLLVACGGPSTPATVAPTEAPASAAGAAEPTVAPTDASTEAPTASTEESAETTVPAETAAAAEATETTDAAATTATAETATAASSAAFPVTIEHKYGSTTLQAAPQRIVTVGLTDHDALLALGVTPVGVTDWFGLYPNAIGPWAESAVGDTRPVVVGDAAAVNFENIAALNPDLILGLYSGMTQEEYDLLIEIAPTIAQPTEYVDFGIPWDVLTRTAGQIVGKSAEAEALIAGIDERFTQERATHPEFAGKRAAVTMPYEGIAVYSPEDPRSRFLTSLGFVIPEELASLAGEDFYGSLSLERADLLDIDLVIWANIRPGSDPLGGPVYQQLSVHTNGRDVMILNEDGPISRSFSFVSVLSIPYTLDRLIPRIVGAIDNDPATPSDASAVPAELAEPASEATTPAESTATTEETATSE